MERVRFIAHQGQQILFVDMTGCTPSEIEAISDTVEAIVTGQPKDSVLILADVTDARFDKDALDHVKKAAALDRPHTKRSAMVGSGKQHTALKEALKMFAQRDYRYFETKEEALAWLISP